MVISINMRMEPPFLFQDAIFCYLCLEFGQQEEDTAAMFLEKPMGWLIESTWLACGHAFFRVHLPHRVHVARAGRVTRKASGVNSPSNRVHGGLGRYGG